MLYRNLSSIFRIGWKITWNDFYLNLMYNSIIDQPFPGDENV